MTDQCSLQDAVDSHFTNFNKRIVWQPTIEDTVVAVREKEYAASRLKIVVNVTQTPA